MHYQLYCKWRRQISQVSTHLWLLWWNIVLFRGISCLRAEAMTWKTFVRKGVGSEWMSLCQHDDVWTSLWVQCQALIRLFCSLLLWFYFCASDPGPSPSVVFHVSVLMYSKLLVVICQIIFTVWLQGSAAMLLQSMKLIKYNLQTSCLLKSSFGHTIEFIVVPKTGLLLILWDYSIFCRFDYNVL